MNSGERNPLLFAEQISKSFPGILALDRVDLQVFKGEVHALVGENGAGKSTLINVLSGVYSDYSGRIYIEGIERTFKNPKDAQDAGIATIHQELNLVDYLSVSENIFLGREFKNKYGLLDQRRMEESARDILSEFVLNINPDALIAQLKVGQQQVVEIAKALSTQARVIIMDEPTSALSEKEVQSLFRIINLLKRNGCAIIYISHKLDELFKIAERITIMRDGKVIDTDMIQNLTYDQIVSKMVGRKVNDFFLKLSPKTGEKVLTVNRLSLKHPQLEDQFVLKKINFSVNEGEILGIYGLMGSGRTELFESLFGLHSKDLIDNEIFIDGASVKINSPLEAIELGMVLIPEDRKREGLVSLMTIRENFSLPNIKKIKSFIFLSKKKEVDLSKEYINKLDIKVLSINQNINELSGGNQQKVVIGKWLATKPRILLMDEPTRGIDVNAKNEIYKLIGRLADTGLAIIIISSELNEIMAICNRIITLSDTRLSGEFTGEKITEENLIKAVFPEINN